MSEKVTTKSLIASLQSTNVYSGKTKHYIDKDLRSKYQLTTVKKEDYKRELAYLQSTTPTPKSKKVRKSKNVPELHADPMREILLRADANTLNNYCQTNKTAAKLCEDKGFWREKYARHNFYLPLVLQEDQTYLILFRLIEDAMKDTKTILTVNAIEYNRVYNKTKGVIQVLIEDMEADNLDDLFSQTFKRHKKGFVNFNELIFQLTDKGYLVKLQKLQEKPIDLGYKSIQEVEKLLSYALTITGICVDDLGVECRIMNDDAFESYDILDYFRTDEQLLRAAVRRGLWEGMQLK